MGQILSKYFVYKNKQSLLVFDLNMQIESLATTNKILSNKLQDNIHTYNLFNEKSKIDIFNLKKNIENNQQIVSCVKEKGKRQMKILQNNQQIINLQYINDLQKYKNICKSQLITIHNLTQKLKNRRNI